MSIAALTLCTVYHKDSTKYKYPEQHAKKLKIKTLDCNGNPETSVRTDWRIFHKFDACVNLIHMSNVRKLCYVSYVELLFPSLVSLVSTKAANRLLDMRSARDSSPLPHVPPALYPSILTRVMIPTAWGGVRGQKKRLVWLTRVRSERKVSSSCNFTYIV